MGKCYKDDDIVTIEAMGFSWRLPWRVVKADVASGLAVLIEE